MLGKGKKSQTFLDAKAHPTEAATVAEIDKALAECKKKTDKIFEPLRDLRIKKAALVAKIEFAKNNFDENDLTAKAELAKLVAQEIDVDNNCKTELKKSGLIDRFTSLTNQRASLLNKDDSQGIYIPPKPRT